MANLSNINNKFLVTTGGNVLIGQTATVGSSIFQVTGSVNITGGTTSGLNITTSGTQDTININRAASNDNAITKYQTASADKWIVGLRNTSDDNFRFYSYGTSTDVLTINQGNGSATFAGTIYASNNDPAYSFASDTNTGMSRTGTHQIGFINQGNTSLTLDALSRATFAENVGIGGAPSSKLHIQQAKSGSSAENYDLLRFNLTGTGAIGDSSSIVWYSTSGTKTAGIEGISGQDNILYGELAFNVRKYTTDSFDEAMRINNRGNVGIGVDPSGNTDRLQIDNPANPTSIRIGDNTTDDCYVVFNTDGNDWSIGTDRSDSNKFKISDHSRVGTNDRLVIDGSGNVGIGTTSPGNLLDVAGDTDITGQLVVSHDANYVAKFVNTATSMSNNNYALMVDSSAHTSNMSTAGAMSVDVNSGRAFTITGAGNVGIGTTSPLGSSKLHVSSANGTAYTSNAQLRVSGGATNNNRATILFSDDALSDGKLSYYPASGTSAYFSLSARGTEADFIVKADGNVGIGTTSPGAKLDLGPAGGIKQYVYSDGGNVRMGFGVDLSGSSRELSIFHPSSNNVDGDISFGYRYESTGAYYERMRITGAGNLGIGTTTFASTANLQLKLGNMGSGVVGEIFDAVSNADNSRIIVCGGGTGTPQFSMRHYSAAYGIDIWLNTNSPWDTYIDNRNTASGFIFRNNCNADGSEDELMSIGSTGRINMFGLDAKGTTGSDVRYNTSTKELYYLTSSKRYKNNIVNLESSLDKINALRPVRFKDIKTGEDACGLIAEETFEIIPDVVFTKEIEGFDEPQIEGLNYSDLVPFLIKSIQELKAEIDELKK